MNSYDRIYNLLTEAKTPRERREQMWNAYREKPGMLKKDREHPQTTLAALRAKATGFEDESRAHTIDQMLHKGRGDPNPPKDHPFLTPGRGDPDNPAAYGGSAAEYKRGRDLKKRDRLAADAERTQTQIGQRLRGEPTEKNKPPTKPGLVGRVKKLISRVTGR